MSVLFKALQKAAKDHEEHQAPVAAFDAERLAGSGVIRGAGGRSMNWRVIGGVTVIAFMAIMGAAVFLTSSPSSPPQMQTVALAPPARPIPTAAAPVPAPVAAEAPVAAPVPASTLTAAAPVAVPVAAAPAVTAPPQTATAAPNAAPVPVEAAAAPAEPALATPEVAEVGAAVDDAELPKARPAPKVAAQRTAQQPMPDIASDSPARMLSPPINIHRSQIDLAGVGNAVQVRRVSQAAQDTVGMAYSALIRGEYDTSLGFYDSALKDEPTSVMALLGRGTALQKLGRKDEARQSYERVLKINAGNREALTNLTALEAERAPGEALARLLDLEKQYPYFSPIKAQVGLIYARMNNLDGALDYLRRALVVTPDAPLYLYNMALVLDRMGLREQAAVAYERSLAVMGAGRSAPDISVADIQRRVDYLRTN